MFFVKIQFSFQGEASISDRFAIEIKIGGLGDANLYKMPDLHVVFASVNDYIIVYIPLQHVNSELLKSMRRGTDSEKTIRLMNKFREEVPDMAIRTTLIVGYPGETEAHFEELKQFVRNTRFDRLGCFAYSHEENTHAYNLMDDVPEEVKERRVAELMELQEQISFELTCCKGMSM